MMRPFKKKKGVTLSPGESMELEFLTQWRRDKDEVVIMTNDGPILLDGKNELFINVAADNMDPIKLQIVPDFKNKVLNFVEIIDPNAPKKFKDTNSPRLTFTGDMVKERNISFGDYLKEWDNDIETIGKNVKNYRRLRNIFVPINILLVFYNLYIFTVSVNTTRYINLAVGIFSTYMVYYIWNTDKKYHNSYKQYKEMREKAFGIVKNK